MSLYKQWTEMVVEYVKTKGEKAFWAEYTKVETAIYRDLLANHKEAIKITIADFAKKYETSVEFIMGFVDGINDSLNNSYDLETIDENTELTLDVNLEKLYFNMLEAKANYLYTLPQWDGIFSIEKRKEIHQFPENFYSSSLFDSVGNFRQSRTDRLFYLQQSMYDLA